MAYDNDNPGKKGITEALKHLRFRKVECSQLHYGESGDDPGSLWDRGGVEYLREMFPAI